MRQYVRIVILWCRPRKNYTNTKVSCNPQTSISPKTQINKTFRASVGICHSERAWILILRYQLSAPFILKGNIYHVKSGNATVRLLFRKRLYRRLGKSNASVPSRDKKNMKLYVSRWSFLQIVKHFNKKYTWKITDSIMSYPMHMY